MSRTQPNPTTSEAPSIRLAVLEFAAAGGNADDINLHAALSQIVARGRSRADVLWQAYRGGAPDARGRVFARFAD